MVPSSSFTSSARSSVRYGSVALHRDSRWDPSCHRSSCSNGCGGGILQFGPNSTIWLLGAELFPTEARGLSHGFTASVGKAGALVSSVVMAHMSMQWQFTVAAVALAAAFLLSILLVPDVSALSLAELDKKWSYDKAGVSQEYFGPAIDKRYLSMWEGYLRSSRFREHSRFQLPVENKASVSEPLLRRAQYDYEYCPVMIGGPSGEISWTLNLEDSDGALAHQSSALSSDSAHNSSMTLTVGGRQPSSSKRGSGGQAAAVQIVPPLLQ